MTSQKEEILEYIKKHGSITSYEAYQKLGITQLGARLDNLGERMRTITRLNSKIHYDCDNRRTRKYHVIQDYPNYYLCECVQEGKTLYRECFLKVDVDDVVEIPVEKERPARVGWHM